jgi:hypothetical protein
MKTIHFFSQSDETDEEGFFLQGEDAKAAELRALKEAGAPDVDTLRILEIEALDRDTAEVKAEVTEAFEIWARSQDIVNE